ncbi:MAG: SIMPL domain-containing protein [Deltaproteobacteria bacterium]|nr:SIMPL domain-containing protein [Deltaproteobacteria bacterium]
MKRLFMVSAVIFSVFLAAVSRADDVMEKGADERTLTAMGSAYEEKAPDSVVIEIAVETASKTAIEAVAENSVKTGRVIEAVKKRLDGDGSIKTSSYNVQPVYEYDKLKRKDILTGFRVANQVIVKTKKISAAGEIIDDAVKSGANRINGLRFFVSDESDLCASALTKASESAKAIASATAKAMSVRLKGIKHIAPYCGVEQQRTFYQAGSDIAALKARETPQTPVEPGAIKVSGTVNVTFYIGD